MKITVTITLAKREGKTCDEDEVFEALETEVGALNVYPQSADSDEESEYEVTDVRIVRTAVSGEPSPVSS